MVPTKRTHGRSFLAAMVLVLQDLALPCQAQVTIFPSTAVAVQGGHAALTCVSVLSLQIENVEWLINDTLLNQSHRSDGVTQEWDIVLRFRNVSAEYNNTRIQCRADNVLSETSILKVQGLLSAVGSLEVNASANNTLLLKWTAPFTLDISSELVDITYCVKVVSLPSLETVHSKCDINVTYFHCSLLPTSGCDSSYDCTVTPTNMAGNGTATSTTFTQDFSGLELVEVTYNMDGTSYSLLMSAPVCDAELTLEDVDTGDTTTQNTGLTIDRNRITFSLTPNRKFRVGIAASNARDRAVSNTQISTHDIRNYYAIQNIDNVTVAVNFTEHSLATGAVFSFIFINEDSGRADFSKSFFQIADKTSVSKGLTLPLSMWYPGQYMLYAYDIESNKKISNGLQYQASNISLTVEDGQRNNILLPQSLNFIISQGRVITVVFPFSRFQVTAQRNSLDSVNILYVNTNMDPQTPATLQVPENGEYLVTVLPIKDGRGILSGLAFSQIHTVTDTPITEDFTSLTAPISTSTPSQADLTTIGLIGGLVCFALLSAVLAVAVVIQCCKQRSSEKMRDQLNQPPAEEDGVLAMETQLYEEIKEPASVIPTQTPANPAPRVPAPALVPQYEDVEISAGSNTKDYHITTCAAYGVPIKDFMLNKYKPNEI